MQKLFSLKMKNPFARPGFDSVLSAEYAIQGSITLASNKTLILDCDVVGEQIVQADQNSMKTCVFLGGHVNVDRIYVANVTITGDVQCDLMIVEGLLAVKAGAKIRAREIRYHELVIENGAVILAQMNHLDHISAGEHE